MDLIKSKINRTDLARMFFDRGFTEGVEVGVMKGKYSEILCKVNPNLRLKSVDPYKEMYYEHETVGWGNIGLEQSYKETLELLSPYNCELIRKPSLEAVVDFPYESLDFVYIDGSHEFDYVMCDIIEWGKRVRKGGIISGHDFNNTFWGVRLAVETYAKAHKVAINLTGDATPSWWFERTW
jgi:hypothetical protein